MQGRWGETPLIAVTFCLALGISLSSLLVRYSFTALALAALLLIAGSVLALLQDRLRLSLATVLSAIALCGLLLALAHRDGYSNSDVRSLLARGLFPLEESLAFDGCALDDSQRRGDELVTTIELRAIFKGSRWLPCSGNGTIRIPAAPLQDMPPQLLRSGDRVRSWAFWRVPRNYQNPGAEDHVAKMARRGIFVAGRIKSFRLLEVIPQDCAPFWARAVVSMRSRLRECLGDLAKEGKMNEAAILRSVVIGDYSELDQKTRDVFQNTGTYHVLVVSGLHVAWLAWVFIRIFRWLRIPETPSRVLSAGGILFYTAIVGFQASISRCLWMFILYLTGQSLFRRASPTNVLLASALFLLCLHPDWLADAGFQLSFLSVMAICQMAGPLTGKKLQPVLDPLRYAGDPLRFFLQQGRWHRLGRRLRCECELLAETCSDRWSETAANGLLRLSRILARLFLLAGEAMLVSISVQIWLEVVLAYHFNRLSWISPIANIIAVPASSLVLASGLIAVLASPIPWLSHPLLNAAGFFASFLHSSTLWMAQIPVAWQRCPTPPRSWLLAALLLVIAWCFFQWKRLWIPCSMIVLILAGLSAGGTLVLGLRPNHTSRPRPARERWRDNARCLRLTFLDVGEGDCSVVCFPGRRTWIVDAGGIRQGFSGEESANAFDIGEAVVSRYLWWEWIGRLDRLVVSHPDIDHLGGMQAVLNNFRAARLDYGEAADDALLDRILAVAKERRVPTHLVRAGNSESVGGAVVRVLNPPARPTGWSTNENSLVLQIAYGGFSALLTGDLEKRGESELLQRQQELHSLLLKVAHHGSRTATLDPLLEGVRPRWGVISVGRNNPFGHPARETLTRMLQHGVRPILTLDHGATTFETDGTHYVIESHVGGLLEQGTLSSK